MSGKESPQFVIDSYRRRQRMTPIIVGGLAGLLVIVGIVILVVYFTGGGNKGGISLFPSATPTATNTFTPTPITPTVTPTLTPTITVTPTVTVTSTPNGPFEHKVAEGESCWSIAVKYNVDINILVALNPDKVNCSIKVGDTVMVPPPGLKLPTDTPSAAPICVKGQKIKYTVKAGDTLGAIAQKYNSTVDDIEKENKTALPDVNKLSPGIELSINCGIITPVPTLAPTSTPKPTTAGGTQATSAATTAATTAATVAPSVTPTPKP